LDWRFWIPIGISLVAVLFSGLLWWNTYHSAFNLDFSAGRRCIAKSPYGSDATLFCTTPIIPLDLSNTGAKGGILRDIWLIIKTDNRTWMLRPQYFCEEFGIRCLEEEKREVFHPIFLGGRERVFKTVIFNPVFQEESLQPPIFSLGSELPREDTWIFNYYILDSSSPNYKFVQKQIFTITKDNILSGSYVPDTNSVIDAHKRLIDKLK